MHAIRIDLRPNCALTSRGALVFFGSICAVSLGLATVLAMRGFWPVLPFSGLEMLGLGWALRLSLERRGEAEAVLISDETVLVQFGERLSRQAEFSRHWAQVRLTRSPHRHHPSRLSIDSHGRSLEIGRFLTEAERVATARRLERLIGQISHSPPLPAGSV